MNYPELSLAVVGIDFPNSDKAKSNRRFEMRLCVPGEPVELRLEPKNKHDEHAIAVFSSRGVQLGYVTAERAPWIGAKIKAGMPLRAVFQGETATAAIIRVRFDGDEPTLPERPAASARPPGGADQDPDDGFFPDPDGPEWGA